MTYPILHIRKGKEQSLMRRHPWVFSGAIETSTESLKDGDLVCLMTRRDQFLGIGHFQHATISVRILSFEDEVIDQAFFDKKIKKAVDARLNIGLLTKENNIFRICHGEGDELPGLVIDFYNGVAVIQCHSIGMYFSVELIAKALKHALGKTLKAVYSKSSDTLPKRQEVSDTYLLGKCETPHVAMENGVKYNIDWITGQKTGFFIDQRVNRKILGEYSKGKKVLNTFCYSGGFSLQALNHGATLVHSLDSSKKAIALTDENVTLNAYTDNHVSIVADAMDYMKDLQEDYDIIVLDPPAFAKHREKRHQAIQGYKRLNAHAIRQIKPGGIIFTFSCSQVIDKPLFTNTIVAAAIESGRNVRILEQIHQPADHPIHAFHPEGEYLKGLIIQVD
jgi:23S rRNA (cytosine1962-C5)-methyltransferase